MPSKYVKEQLKKVSFANLNNYDAEHETYLIPKYSKPRYELNKGYIIRVPATIVGKRDSVIAINWNNSTCPTTNILKVYVSKILGKMIYVDTVGYDGVNNRDLSNYWSGWLPTDEIEQLMEAK